MGSSNYIVFEIRSLSKKFYADYPHVKYPEILCKNNRPYKIALFSFANYYVGVPFRSHMNHKYGFAFKSIQGSRKRPGLDYTKIVVFNKNEYLDSEVDVDNAQNKELIQHIAEIANEVQQFIETYVNHQKGISLLHQKEFQRRYKHTTLSYFHDVLGI